MAAETAVLVTISTSLASGLLKGVALKAVDALSKSSAVTGLTSALFEDLEPQLCHLERELCKLNDIAESLNPLDGNCNGLVLKWLRGVNEAAYFADDLLDDISYDQIKRQVKNKRSRLGGLVPLKLFSSSNPSLEFRVKINHKVSKFMSMTAEIYKEAAEIGLRPVELVANAPTYRPPTVISDDLREVRENVDTSFVVGRQGDEDRIVHQLCHAMDHQVLGVVAIIGISGVGKTTLARKVYDNEMVRKHFDRKAWIFVSDNFNLRRILDEMLQSLTGDNHNLSNIGAMEEKLQGVLEQKSCLLVLDDVWNTDSQVWDSVWTSLVRITCSGGSKVLLTTQSSKVASTMGAYLIHNLEVLHGDDAWALFGEKAFANKTQEQISNLKDIGGDILKNCGGLPLAIKTLGSLLGSMNEKSQWESVLKSEVWSLSVGQTKIMPWLLISFNHLPNATVKQCFAHCPIIIPKGMRLRNSILIEAWIAQGFIQPLETNETSMDTLGQTYINTLSANGLLQLVYDDGRCMCTMHDLVHDLSVYVSKETTFITRDADDLPKASGAKHIVVRGKYTGKTEFKFSNCNKLTKIHTLVCWNGTISMDFVSQARFLRLLYLVNCGVKKVPSLIGRLKHLRLLALCNNPFEYLPETIGALFHLRVLNIQGCQRLMKLPQQITTLVNLRHIYASEDVHIPKGIGQLTCLVTLPTVNMKANEGWKLKELQSMALLSGWVSVKGLEHINCEEDAAIAGLNKKPGITNLILMWTSDQGQEANTVSNDKEVMDGLQPHSNLIYLWVGNFRGNRFSNWLTEQLYSLKQIFLFNCKRCEQLPALGQLRSLEDIVIHGMASIKVIGINFYISDERVTTSSSGNSDKSKNIFFPKLKKLVLQKLPQMKDWFDPSGLCDIAFPCLEYLEIKDCPLLASAPTCLQTLNRLTMNGINSEEALMMVLRGSNSLSSLKIENVRHLNSLSQELLKCTYLQELRIENCKELTELPASIQSLGALEILHVKGCDRLTSIPNIDCHLSLRVLTIYHCRELTETPLGLENCVSIEGLSFAGCLKLNLIPDLKRLSHLQNVVVTDFSKQMSIPGWLSQLSSLEGLFIGGFNEELDELYGFDCVPKNLRHLDLVGWPRLKSIPRELKFFTQLVLLGLFRFEGVEALPEWLGNLSSLSFLEIGTCKNMKYLPPLDAMRRLTHLSKFKVNDCPILEERCNKDRGKEWHKISHIPSIIINGKEIQNTV